jgi:hypothetical protein
MDFQKLFINAVVIDNVLTNEIIFKVSTKSIGQSFWHIVIMFKSTSCLSLNINIDKCQYKN